jgi:hypothetical protein
MKQRNGKKMHLESFVSNFYFGVTLKEKIIQKNK